MLGVLNDHTPFAVSKSLSISSDRNSTPGFELECAVFFKRTICFNFNDNFDVHCIVFISSIIRIGRLT